MKKFVTATLLTLSVISAHAEIDPSALPSTLARTMKAMSNDLKTITTQGNNSQMNSNSATLADEFVQLVLHSKDFTPDSISSLSADKQAAAKAEYDKALDQTADLGRQLASAFRANNNTLAAALLNQLVQAKKDGHSQFKD